MSALVLALSPGQLETAMALFRGLEPVRAQAVQHGDELRSRRADPRAVRARAVRAFLDDAGIAHGGLAAVAGRAGVLRPLEGGTYAVCDQLLRDSERALRQNPANVGATLAHSIAAEWGCPAFVVDPESVDERDTLARLAHPCTVAPRTQALALRAAAHRHARAVRRPIEDLRLVICHLAAGVSLCAHRNGRMVDVIELWDDRQLCPNGCGVPMTALADLDGRAAPQPSIGTTRISQELELAERGDARAILSLQAASYRIARAVGELATTLEGEVDAVLLAGPLAAAGPVVAEVCRRVEWIAPVFLYRDEDDLRALAEGVLRVLTGEEPAKRY